MTVSYAWLLIVAAVLMGSSGARADRVEPIREYPRQQGPPPIMSKRQMTMFSRCSLRARRPFCNFYETTLKGGADDSGTVYRLSIDAATGVGTVFKLIP
jgi:uncharacterized repeat protein (TIGR03803 family)